MLRGFKAARLRSSRNFGEILHPFGATDYSTFMPRLLSLKPDVLCIFNFGRDQQIRSSRRSTSASSSRPRSSRRCICIPAAGGGPDPFEGVVGGCVVLLGPRGQVRRQDFNDAFRQMAAHSDRLRRATAMPAWIVLPRAKCRGTDTDKVVEALEALKYDFYKGPQHYRKCDHQSVQSVLVLKSKKKSAMATTTICSRSSPTTPARRHAAQLQRTRPPPPKRHVASLSMDCR